MEGQMQVSIKSAVASAAALTTAIVMLAGCASPRSASVYKAGETQREQSVRLATIESVRDVTVDRGQTGVGIPAGAVVGGVAGSAVGHGKGAIVGAVLGAVVGGVAGQSIENSATRVAGVELTVRLDNGDLRAIVQEADAQQFKPGDRVRLLSQGGVTRVSR